VSSVPVLALGAGAVLWHLLGRHQVDASTPDVHPDDPEADAPDASAWTPIGLDAWTFLPVDDRTPDGRPDSSTPDAVQPAATVRADEPAYDVRVDASGRLHVGPHAYPAALAETL